MASHIIEVEWLLKSFKQAPLLLGDVPEARVFDRSLLDGPTDSGDIDFKQKLGHLYEDGLEVLLKGSIGIRHLVSHLQLMDGCGRTLGEFDFLVVDESRRQAIHLELAVKFYLAIQIEGKWQFPGPDARDNLQRKVDRMRSHQLVLSQRPEAQALLLERFEIDKIEVRHLVYGCLFYPMTCQAHMLPEAVNPDCRKGRWLYVSEWSQHFDLDERLSVIPKPLWPVEINQMQRDEMEVVSVAALIALARERCTMFVTDGSCEPIFLAPDDWLTV